MPTLYRRPSVAILGSAAPLTSDSIRPEREEGGWWHREIKIIKMTSGEAETAIVPKRNKGRKETAISRTSRRPPPERKEFRESPLFSGDPPKLFRGGVAGPDQVLHPGSFFLLLLLLCFPFLTPRMPERCGAPEKSSALTCFAGREREMPKLAQTSCRRCRVTTGRLLRFPLKS